jgi:hypothetical protein
MPDRKDFPGSWLAAVAAPLAVPARNRKKKSNSLRRLKLALLIRRQRLGEQRVKQTTAGFVGRGEARLQPVAKRHQPIDLGNDALFGHWREWKCHRSDHTHTQIGNADAAGASMGVSQYCLHRHRKA